jgi:two-component system NtrC family sensor kinase
VPGIPKDSQRGFLTKGPRPEVQSLQKKILLIDPYQLFEQRFHKEVTSEAFQLQYQLVQLKLVDQLVDYLRNGHIDIVLAVGKQPEDAFAILELARELSPQSSRLLIAQTWNEQSVRSAVNRTHVFRMLNLNSPPEELLMHLQAASVEADLGQTQLRLMREASKRNRELESLTSGLEKTVEERTLHIRKSKEEMDSKVDLVRQLIRFIKDLSKNMNFEELMDLVRKDFKKFAKLGDPILLVRSQADKVEVLAFRSGAYASSNWETSSIQKLRFPETALLSDENLRHELANFFGRPFVRTISIPIHVKLIRKFGFSEASAALCIECSMGEEEQSRFLDHVIRILQPLSMAIDRAFLQRALTMQSYRWERTFDGLRDPLAIVDVDYHVLHSNKKFSEKILQKTCYESFAHKSTPCEGCPMSKALERGQTQTGQIQIEGRLYQVSAYPIQMSDSARTTTVVSQYVDITQSRQLYARMLQSEKMGALGLLAGNIAHELNNPLSGIRSLAQVMITETDKEPALQSDLKEIEKAASRSQLIIKNLLDFSYGTPQKLQLISLAEIVDKTMPLLKTNLRQHRCKMKLGAQELKVKVDSQLMQQVVFNLVTNACQAMENAGDLTIITREIPAQSTEPARAELVVADSGPGIPFDLHEKIFQPFFTTKQEGQGTGLGLSLSRDIVRKMGGDIQLISEVGKGSEFHVSLPIASREGEGI